MKGEKHDPKQAHNSISQKSAIAILPPKKVCAQHGRITDRRWRLM